MNSDIEIIKGRLTLLFKRRPQTRYWLMLTNDTYDQTYNLFFNSQRANERLQSVPLHKLANYDLADLENSYRLERIVAIDSSCHNSYLTTIVKLVRK